MINQLYYSKDLEELFVDVQTQRIFADQKVFPDCKPRFSTVQILKKYRIKKDDKGFDLLDFIKANFVIPENIEEETFDTAKDPVAHIEFLWDKLTKETENEFSSLIHVPNKFVVPGGRFRELFYWDSYFTMLGLQVSGRVDLIENMVDNFAYLISEFGFIPNANRTYFLSRSQPPFFSLMVDLLAEEKGDFIYLKYLPELKREYAFWMNGADKLTQSSPSFEHSVLLSDGAILNRYWDKGNAPRPEGYYEDLEIYNQATSAKGELYRNIRAACTSGWDFSGRWFANGKDIETIRTTDLIPVDLNCLLWHLETTLAKVSKLAKLESEADFFQKKAEERRFAIKKYLWNDGFGAYFDYDFKQHSFSEAWSMAMVFPLFFGLASDSEAIKVIAHLQNKFLKDGGLLTTLNATGQQWDAPNGWAPLQWIGYKAAYNYGEVTLATSIAKNWIATVDRVFKNTGKIMEKYNVVDISLLAGGGEYPNQNGFGWTNGVYLKMKNNQNKL